MPTLMITRGPSATTVRREDVPTFATFAIKNRDGRLGKEYLHVGCNGRAYAVNATTRELASSENYDKSVILTGRWEFDVTRSNTTRAMRRSQVRPGDVFVVQGNTTEYAAMGAVHKDRTGWLSVPLDRPQNHAIATNGDTNVNVIGSFALRVTSSK